ncbi:MAG TPA: response regulator [Vicinamibacterales bacterium]|nr:response regulator [Vicinamibacterales bacterium]
MPHTLLLADDSVTIQRVIELTFADEDVEVIAVSDGGQAIERLELAPPDIVLADVAMPRVNGYQVAQYIRQTPRLAHIPVVLLTGAFEPVDRSRAAEAGCDDVLAKPFEPQMVIGRVKELLSRPRGASSFMSSPGFASEDHQPQGFGNTQFGSVLGPTPVPRAQEFMPGMRQSPTDELDEYFDRLDAAFANLANEPLRLVKPGPLPSSHVEPARSVEGHDLPAGVTDETFQPTEPTEPAESKVREESGRDWAQSDPHAAGSMDAELEEWLAHDAEASASDLPLVPLNPLSLPRPDLPITETPTVSMARPDLPTTRSDLSTARPDVSMSRPDSPPAPPDLTRQSPDRDLTHRELTPKPFVPPPIPLANIGKDSNLPPMADAFAALLAEELNEPPPAPAPTWHVAGAMTPAVTDDLVDQVTRRVLERLADRVVRDSIVDVVSKVAERLVREEIDRIKSSIR